jgi:hypothetical protein
LLKASESFPGRIERFGQMSVMILEEVSRTYLQHIIDASHRKSFDPYKEIDWNIPFDYSYFYMPLVEIEIVDSKVAPKWRSAGLMI